MRAEIYNLSTAAGLAYDALNRDTALPWIRESAARAQNSAEAFRLLAREVLGVVDEEGHDRQRIDDGQESDERLEVHGE